MNISIDFDNTYTQDRELWNEFIRLAQSRKHNVYCVTARHANKSDHLTEVLESIGKLVGVHNCVFTGNLPKRPFCEANNIHIDVWIDDMPENIPALV